MNGRVSGLLWLLPLAFGCAGADDALRLDEQGAVAFTLRNEAEVRKCRGEPWDLPAPPGSVRSESRERGDVSRGGGLFLRARLDVSLRDLEESKLYATARNVDGTILGPGSITGRFRLTREELAFSAGYVSLGQVLRIGGGIRIAATQFTGTFRDGTAREEERDATLGFGVGVLMELSPGFPPLRGFVEACALGSLNTYADEGKGHETWVEAGLRYQFLGFTLYAAYRIERTTLLRSDADRVFRFRGPLVGAGISF